jgi:hypothetical protein
MSEDKNQLPQEDPRQGVEIDPNNDEAYPAQTPYQLRVSRRVHELMALILLIGILVIAFVFWRGRTKNPLTVSHRPSSLGVQAGDGDPESTPEVRYATRGEWIETSGPWSKFGVVGAAFDGEKIVMSSAESPRGSLGCWVSPRGRPLSGACFEIGAPSTSKLPAGRTCTWQIVVLEISPTTMRGVRMLKRGESDPDCAEDYKLVPSAFMLERPHGRPDRPSK